LYLFTGYPTHFGQLECMKLTASPHFPEKRIGYLGMMLLLTEDADVLMLSTNALKNDLTSNNKFIAGLALCAIGNLATADMSRDLAPEVDKHLKSNLAYLRKKACLAMARCLAKCPDMTEDFIDRLVSLLKDKSHGVVLCAVELMTHVLMIDVARAQEQGDDPWTTPCRLAFVELVPALVKMLRNLLSSGVGAGEDGSNDPFLQVQLLTMLRLLGVCNAQASEQMNDVLAQVASQTETAKNAGNAILYECVQTIMGIESEDGLRVLAVNILGRFLLNRDNNIRYVALNTLARCILEQKQRGDVLITESGEGASNAMSALQRHRTTVVDCLKDPDVSIRQRALELIYHLVNEDNVEQLTAELLNYLVLCPREHKADICRRVLQVVDRYSPNDRWRVDTLLTTLTIAGREAPRDFQSATVVYVSRADRETHAFATHKLIKAIRDDDGSQHGLLSVGIWCVGEYGDLLLQPCTYTPMNADSDDGETPGPITLEALDPDSIVHTIEQVCDRQGCPEQVKQRALTAYVKLFQRFTEIGETSTLNHLDKLLQKHSMSHSLEMQLRACEYTALINATRGLKIAAAPAAADDDIFGVSASNGGDSSGVSAAVVAAAIEAIARMPVFDSKLLERRLAGDQMEDGDVQVRAPRATKAAIAKGGGGSDDLLDIFGESPAPTSNGSTSAAVKSDLDLLADVFSAQATPASGVFDPFGGMPVPVATNPMDLFGAPTASTSPMPAAALNPMDLFGPTPTQTNGPAAALDLFGANSVATVASSDPIVPAFSHNGLSADFVCTKPDTMNQQKSQLIAHFKNTTGAPIHGLNLQVAVPKYVKMEMDPPSSTTVPPTGGMSNEVTQSVTVTNSMLGTKNLMLKLKVTFTSNGQTMEHMATASGFPAGQY
jgi:AP-1 complex subunit gamma-1